MFPPQHCMRNSCGSQTSCVRQKICFERASALALPLLLKKEERAGERRHFLSVSPLSDSLPARSSRGERAKPRKRFACRTQLFADPRSEQSQRDWGLQPKVGVQRLPWVRVRKPNQRQRRCG